MNKVLLVGRLTKDAELRHVGGNDTAVLTFTLAVNGNYVNSQGEREVDFIPVTLWSKRAESLAQYLKKGILISVSGKIQVKSYEAKDGIKKYITQVVADDIQFVETKKNKEQQEAQ